MGRNVQTPTSIQGILYRTMQKLSKAINECAILYDRASGILGPDTQGTLSNSATYALEYTLEVDTGYVPLEEERISSEWICKVYNVQGTFNGTGTEVGFDCIPIVSPVATDTVKILVNVYGKNLTDYATLTADWVLQQIDK